VADKSVELIRRIPFFSGLDRRELEEVARSMKERTFDAGGPVVEEGKTGAGFFVIESGTARVSVGGREVRTLGPGDHFGEIALIADTPRTATITPETELRCYGLSAWDFRGIVEGNATIAWKLLETLARRLADAEQRSLAGLRSV
jgi:CRP/FNR family cyclic AMP-dependent transcriptional regulator